MKAQVIKVTHDDLVGTIEVLKAFRQICSDSPEEEGRQETIDALTMAIVICTAFLCDNFAEEAEETEQFCEDIDDQPTIEPERKKGKWTDDNACPFCGFQPWYERDIHTLSFCPNCGAKMEG